MILFIISLTFKLRFSTTRLFGLLLVRKEDRCPMEDDSAQCAASDRGFPRTSRLKMEPMFNLKFTSLNSCPS